MSSQIYINTDGEVRFQVNLAILLLMTSSGKFHQMRAKELNQGTHKLFFLMRVKKKGK